MSRLARLAAITAGAWLLFAAALQALAFMAPWLRGAGEAIAAMAPATRDLTLGAVLLAATAMLADRRVEPGARDRLSALVAACGLNLAILLRLLAEPMLSFAGTSGWRRMLVAAGLLHVLGVLGLLALAWRSFSATSPSRSR